MDKFVMEVAPDQSYQFGFAQKKKIFEKQSSFQKIEIYETAHHGRVLLHDGFFMLSERDEAIYHEMIAHVPLFVHPDPRRVLIIGGGDGGTAREVLRHQNVERCVMVEIDEDVVEACREFFPKIAGALSDSRLELLIQDGVEYMKSTSEKFDVIIIDSTDPIGPATPLFGEEFYEDVRDHLTEKGIVVAQGESVFYDPGMQPKLLAMNQGHFEFQSVYNFTNLTYPGGYWSFFMASKSVHPVMDFDVERYEAMDHRFIYYNEDIHRAAFALPQFQRAKLDPWISI